MSTIQFHEHASISWTINKLTAFGGVSVDVSRSSSHI